MSLLDPDSGPKQRRVQPVPVAIAGIVLLLAGGLAVYVYGHWLQRVEDGPVLTEEAREYLEYLDLSEVQMAAEESFLTHRLVTIEGNITNSGERTVRLVEIHCLFRDPHGVEIAREPAVIVGARGGPLAPGETKSFRLAFDELRRDWNQVMPSLFISQIAFE